MKRLPFAIILALITAAASFAQSTPRIEIFGGGAWVRADISPDLKLFGLAHVNAYGWNTSVTENLNSWFGGTLDFSGIYSRPIIKVSANAFGSGLPPADVTLSNEINASAYTFMYGPVFAYRRNGRFVPFARILAGVANGRASTTSKSAALIGEQKFSQTHFALAAGGGMDVTLTRVLALRGTVDWIRTAFPDQADDRQNNIRVAGGLVLRFGGK